MIAPALAANDPKPTASVGLEPLRDDDRLRIAVGDNDMVVLAPLRHQFMYTRTHPGTDLAAISALGAGLG